MDEAAPAFRDRTPGLVLFGLLAILIAGVLAIGMLGPLMGALGVGGQHQPLPPRLAAASFFSIVPMAAFFGTMGIGSILGRRWACALLHAGSWLWLIIGLQTFIVMILSAGQMRQAMEAQSRGKVPPEMAGCIQGMMLVFMAIGYIILPVAFLLFYRSPHVKATCQKKDPQPGWTDRVPLSVLPLLLLGVFGVSIAVGNAVSGVGIPFFGTIVTGPTAMLISLAAGVLAALIVRGLARLRRWAWTAAVGLLLVSSISTIITFSRVDFYEMYRGTGASPELIDQMKSYFPRGAFVLSAMGGVGILVYLGCIRKRFVA